MSEEEEKAVAEVAEAAAGGEGEGEDEAPAEEHENTAHFDPVVSFVPVFAKCTEVPLSAQYAYIDASSDLYQVSDF